MNIDLGAVILAASLLLGPKSYVLDVGRPMCVQNYWPSNITIVADDSLGHRLEVVRLRPNEVRCATWDFRHKGRLLYVVRGDTLAGRWQ